MTLDLQSIIDSKRAYRQSLAGRPVAEKLAMLDKLRERTLTIRRAAARRDALAASSEPPPLPTESSENSR